MTELEKAARQVLEALEAGTNHGVAIDALRRALEPAMRPATREEKIVCPGVYEVPVEQQPVDEPVLWEMPDGKVVDKWALQFYKGPEGRPLYARPQTEDEPVACVGPWHDARLTLIPRYSGQVFERDQPLYTRPQPAAPAIPLSRDQWDAWQDKWGVILEREALDDLGAMLAARAERKLK